MVRIDGIPNNDTPSSVKLTNTTTSLWTGAHVKQNEQNNIIDIDDRKNDIKAAAENLKITEKELYKILEQIGYSKERLFSMSGFCDFIDYIQYTFVGIKDIEKNLQKTNKINQIVANVKNLQKKDISIEAISNVSKKIYNKTPIGTLQEELKDSDLDEKIKEKLNSAKSLNDFNHQELVEIIKAFFKFHQNNKNVEQAKNTFDIMVTFLVNGDKNLYEKFYKAFKEFALSDEKLSKIFNITEKLKIANEKDIELFLNNENVQLVLKKCGYTQEQFKQVIINIKNSLNEPDGIIAQKDISAIYNILTNLAEDYKNLSIEQKENKEEFNKNEQKSTRLKVYKELNALILSLGNKDEQKKALELAQKSECEEDILKFVYQIAKERPDLNIQAKLDEITSGKFSEFVEKYENQLKNENVKNSTSDNSSKTSDNAVVGFNNPTQDARVNSANEYIKTFFEQNNTEENKTSLVLVKDDKNNNFSTSPMVSAATKTIINNSTLFARAWAEGLIKIEDIAKDFRSACSEAVQLVWNCLNCKNEKEMINLLVSWHNGDLSSEAAAKYHFDESQIEKLGLGYCLTNILKNKYEQLNNSKKITIGV